MPVVFSIIWFVLVNAAGFFTGSGMFILASILHLTPQAGDPGAPTFIAVYFPGVLWSWIAGLIVSLGYFYFSKGWRLACLWAPVYVPMVFAAGVIAFFM